MNMQRTKEHYGSLDGVRAYAATGIVLMHVLENSKVRPSDNFFTDDLIPFFNSFVFLFMMVSGFSLCCGYYDRMKGGSITPGQFYKKRYTRILPFFAILCFIDLCAEPSMATLLETFANLTLCFGLLPSSVEIHVIGVGWFLGVVFLFYMLFPFFVFLLDNRHRAWFSLLVAMGLSYVVCVYFPVEQRHKCMLFCAPYFLVGGIVYLYRGGIRMAIRTNKFAATAICIALTVGYLLFQDSLQSLFVRQVALVMLFLCWTAGAISMEPKVLDNKIAVYLSGLSMEIYLAHMLIFRVVETLNLNTFIHQSDILYLANVVSTFLGAVVFAHVMKRYVLPAVEWVCKSCVRIRS